MVRMNEKLSGAVVIKGHNVLMSEPGVDQPLQAHTAMTPAFELGTNMEHFHVVGLTAIENHSFLMINRLIWNHFLC